MRYFFSTLYPLLYTLCGLLYLPFHLRRKRRARGPRVPLLERAGRIPRRLRQAHPKKGPRLWVHAVSVGEAQAVQPLLASLGADPAEVFLSTTTETGQELARSLLRDDSRVFYFPLDWQWACRRYLRAVDPDAVALAETELWPGFILAARRLKVPLVLVNGRVSDGSFRRYRRLRPLLKPLLECFAAFCMQSRQDKERILELGAPAGRVHLTGNLKYDYQLAENSDAESLVEGVQRLLKPQPGDLLWVCGSTREKEEALLLDAFCRLAPDFPRLSLLIAPRHPSRAEEVAALVRARGLPCQMRSRIDWGSPPTPAAGQVLVVDSIGELAYLYRAADVVFVGGSLFPTGGQNIIEAAHHSKPILFGPHMENFREIAAAFLHSYAALQLQGPQELVPKLRDLLRDPAARNWLGRNARKVVRDNQGAVRRTAEIVRECAKRPGPT